MALGDSYVLTGPCCGLWSGRGLLYPGQRPTRRKSYKKLEHCRENQYTGFTPRLKGYRVTVHPHRQSRGLVALPAPMFPSSTG